MKFAVTPELATLVKTMRAQNALATKETAEHLHKSPSYLSKLEGGEIKTIQQETLTDLLLFTTRSSDFFGEALPAAWRALQSFMEPGRLLYQVWLIQYDTVERKVAIPPGMAEDLMRQLEGMGAGVDRLVALANRNIDSEMTGSLPANQIICLDYEGRPRLMARADIDPAVVKDAMEGRGRTLSYLTVNNVVYTLFRMLRCPDAQTKLPPKDAVDVLRCTASYMDRWGLHSLTSFSHLVSSDEFISQQVPLVHGGEGVLERVHERMGEIARHDAVNATSQLNTFLNTVEWDPSFALKLVGIPFSDLGPLSFNAKKHLLDDIQALLDKYDSLPDVEKRIENY